jgi:primary-amine oxidase
MIHIMRALLVLLLPALLFSQTPFAQNAADPPAPQQLFHPMDALTPEEVKRAVQLLKAAGHADDSTLYATLALLEPPKDVVLDWSPEQALPDRLAHAVLRHKGKTFEARINLTTGKVLAVVDHAGKHPLVLDANWTRARNAFLADDRFKAALKRRGLTPGKDILCTPNSAGYLPGENDASRPILKVPCFHVGAMLHRSLARPIEGLMGVVDSETGEVLSVYDKGEVPLPPAPFGYGTDLPKQDPPMARIGHQMEGLGNIKLTGNLNVEWLNWRFHVRPDKRAGMIVSLVDFRDRKATRRMAYQMNVSEMFVPYMDPDPTWAYRAFMDAGEFGLGYLLSSLQPGVDCPDTAAFIDATFPNDTGGTYVRARGFCVFERNTGDPAWRHYASGRKIVYGEPQVELVVRHIPTLGNYDYVVDYVFTPQGGMQLRVGATGFDAIRSAAAADMEAPSAKADTEYGNLIAPYTVAPYHDHYINFRLDLDVDGVNNTLLRDVFVPQGPAPQSPRSLWTLKTQRYLKEGPVVADHSAMAGQMLRLSNPTTRNGLKQQPSLWLNAHHDAQSVLAAEDPAQQRAQFAMHQFWLTRYKPDELWSAGLLPNLNPADEGLPRYVADAEDAAATDVVLWYTMGFRHVTRPEDFPILPTFWHEMSIRPVFFFDLDPSMTFNSGLRK